MSLSPATVGFGVFLGWFGFGFALPASAVIRWGGGLLLALFTSTLGAAIGAGGTAAGSPARPAASSSSTSGTPAAPTYHLALISARGYESEYGGYHYVEGQVKNVSDRSLKNVTAVATWYDKDGNFIKSDDALIDYNPILPGQTSPFKTITSGNPAMSRFSVDFKTLMGGTLSVEDLRKK